MKLPLIALVALCSMTLCDCQWPILGHRQTFPDYIQFAHTLFRVVYYVVQEIIVTTRNFHQTQSFAGINIENSTDFFTLLAEALADGSSIIVNTLGSRLTLGSETSHRPPAGLSADQQDAWWNDPSHNPLAEDGQYGEPGSDLGRWGGTAPCDGVDRLLTLFYTISGIGKGLLESLRTWPDPVTEYNRATFILFNSRLSASPSDAILDYSNSCGTLYYNSPVEDFANYTGTRPFTAAPCIDRNLDTYFIIHGLVDAFRPIWEGQLRDKIMEKAARRKQHVNVIGIDWRHGSQDGFFNKVSANVRLVAAQLNRVISKLNLDPKKVRMIGHSFGTHVAGIAGFLYYREHQARFAHILALDPPDMCFYRGLDDVYFNDTLSQLSALHVVAIHANGDLFDTYKLLAHQDIFINSADTQPACPFRYNSMQSPGQAAVYSFLCSHNRFTEIINYVYNSDTEPVNDEHPSCYPVAYPCKSYGDFLQGRCYECDGCYCAIAAGEHQYNENNLIEQYSPRRIRPLYQYKHPAYFDEPRLLNSSQYYTIMGENAPWCHYMYRIEIGTVAQPPGTMAVLTLLGKDANNDDLRFHIPFELSKATTQILHYPAIYGAQIFEKANLTFANDVQSTPYTSPYFAVLWIEVRYMSHVKPAVIKKFSSSLCSEYFTLKDDPEVSFEDQTGSHFFDADLGPFTNPPIATYRFDKKNCNPDTPSYENAYKQYARSIVSFGDLIGDCDCSETSKKRSDQYVEVCEAGPN